MPLRAVFPGRGSRTTAYACALLGLLASGPSAIAQNVGGTPSTPAPRISILACKTECSGVVYSRPGSLIAVRGRDFDGVESVVFLGRTARGDEIATEPEQVGRSRLTVRVPRRAASGRLVLVNGDGATSKPSRTRLRVEDVATRKVSGGNGPGLEVAVTGRKVFFDAERRPTLTYMIRDAQPVRVVVEVVRVGDGVAVARFDQGLVNPNEPRLVSWDGLGSDGVQPDGRYEFRVYAENSQGVRASSAQAGPQAPAAGSPDSFLFLSHKFPVRGKHDWGGHAASFGGGRNHQGQDVFARCGTPLVAARGGTVRFEQYHARAGHYIVIDGEQTDVDYVYMHLQEESPLDKGDRVHTGQVIGAVGDTGRAHGCHLHFEMWSGPGWYLGGSAFDPLPHLKAWDKFS